MANKIIIGPLDDPVLQFEDDKIVSIVDESAVSLIGAELAVDLLEPEIEYTVYVDYTLISSDGYKLISSDGYELRPFSNYDLRKLPYATKVTYLSGNRVNGEFFSKNVERVGKSRFKINAMSAVGLMNKQPSKGGIYTGQRFDAVLAEVLGEDYEYSITDDAAALQVYGWLPYSTRRNNLHQLITAYGVNIIRSDTGGMLFTILGDTTPEYIPEARIYLDGSVDYGEAASRVEVTEHAFFYLASAAEETVFDNTSSDIVDNALITFDKPFYADSIYCSEGNLSIIEAHTNYAIVSGIGILAGKPYTHTTKIVSADNENAVVERVVQLKDDTLVTTANADNVLLRLSAYYFNATIVRNAVQLEGEKCGRRYDMLNAFYERTSGFLSKISATASNITKAECEFIENYVPTGQGNTYMYLDRLTAASGVWTIPESVFEKPKPYIRVVLIGPGEKGKKGATGESGEAASETSGGKGGAGGLGGEGGAGGKIVSMTIDCTGLKSLTYAVGSLVTAQIGTNFLSSANGVSSPNGFLEVFSGTVYALPGQQGKAGGKGGKGGLYKHTGDPRYPENGEAVTYGGKTYAGGTAGAPRIYEIRPESNDCYIGGTGGGGAAVGAKGGNGDNGWAEYGKGGGKGAKGAAGPAASSVYGSGGNGGHGGGGGGGGDYQENWNWLYSSVVGIVCSDGGPGGAGGDGSDGAPGCILIYY